MTDPTPRPTPPKADPNQSKGPLAPDISKPKPAPGQTAKGPATGADGAAGAGGPGGFGTGS